MNILITGGSGYLGYQISEKFIKNGHIVTNIDLFPTQQKINKFHKVDILDIQKLEKIFEECKFDIIIHNAAKVPISKLKKSFYDINVIGTENILKMFDKYKVKKLVFISSSAVYGIPDKMPILENDLRYPCEDYGISKKLAEDKCIELMKEKNITILRPRTILGMDRMGIFSILFYWIQSNLKVPVLNNGDNKYQFIDIRDFVNATYLASFSDYRGFLNIGSEKFYTMRELLQSLINEVGSKSLIIDIEKNYLVKIAKMLSKLEMIPLKTYHFEAYGKDIFFDISLAKKVLNWKPLYSNKESIVNSYNAFVTNKNMNLSSHSKKINNLIMKFATFFI